MGIECEWNGVLDWFLARVCNEKRKEMIIGVMDLMDVDWG